MQDLPIMHHRPVDRMIEYQYNTEYQYDEFECVDRAITDQTIAIDRLCLALCL